MDALKLQNQTYFYPVLIQFRNILSMSKKETSNIFPLPLTLYCSILFFFYLLHSFKTSFSPLDVFYLILAFDPKSRSIPFLFNPHSSQS